MERKPISKSVRFEVFKRDKFTCQYCGAKAPEAVLHIDHVKPVAEGGDNDIMNLLTACQGCNGGKGKRLLSDSTAIDKQRAQIEELEERRQQIEMMLQWRSDLASIQQPIYDVIIERFRTLCNGFVPNELGMIKVRKWVKQYSLEIIIESIEETISKYGVWQGNEITPDSWQDAFERVARFCAAKVKYGSGPDLDRLLYIQGIIRNRVGNKWLKCLDDLKSLRDAGYTIEQIEGAAKNVEDEDDYGSWVNYWNYRTKGGAS
jgi:hypothetical protein